MRLIDMDVEESLVTTLPKLSRSCTWNNNGSPAAEEVAGCDENARLAGAPGVTVIVEITELEKAIPSPTTTSMVHVPVVTGFEVTTPDESILELGQVVPAGTKLQLNVVGVSTSAAMRLLQFI